MRKSLENAAMATTQEHKIHKGVQTGLIVSLSALALSAGVEHDWKRDYECRSAERRVANPIRCYEGYSKEFKKLAMHGDSVSVYGAEVKNSDH